MKITSFEQACERLGHNPVKVIPDVSMLPAKHQAALVAYSKLLLIVEAINEGHEFNWNDWKEQKWCPWFDLEVTKDNPSGFQFLDAYCVRMHSVAPGGSRLCFKTQTACEHAAKTFEDLYRDMIIVPK